ncbi:MAG TPA: type IV secretion system DNA-binding domain-containing protein [Guyparkeria sp.]|nr:type IV secretion system DNA-binding domain-containing protein [Guyparkeria sp.]
MSVPLLILLFILLAVWAGLTLLSARQLDTQRGQRMVRRAGIVLAATAAVTHVGLGIVGDHAIVSWLQSDGRLMLWAWHFVTWGTGIDYYSVDALKALASVLAGIATATVYEHWVLSTHRRVRHRRGAQISERGVGDRQGVIRFANGVSIPAAFETRGMMAVGAPGTGKTQIIRRALNGVRKRGQRAIVVDAGGDLMKSLYRDGDAILCPGDERSIDWSPLAEIRQIEDVDDVAQAIVPERGSTDDWDEYARTILSAVLQRVYERGGCNRDVVHYCTMSSWDEMREICAGTPAQSYFEEGSERMTSNVKNIMSSKIRLFVRLNPDADANSDSLRRWVMDTEGTSRWLWLPFHGSPAATAQLRRAMIEMLITGLIDAGEDLSRRIWFVLDELPQHGKIDLPRLAELGRKFGSCVISGYQSISQLRDVYTRDTAQTITSCLGSTVILRTPDPDTAEYLSRTIGEAEIEREQLSSSRRGKGETGSVSRSERIERERVVMPSQIQGLCDLNGYLVCPAGIAEIEIEIVKTPRAGVPAYLPVARPKPKAAASRHEQTDESTTDAKPAANADTAGDGFGDLIPGGDA